MTEKSRNGTGVVCQDCPYQDVWHPVRTERDQCKHDLVHEGHTVEYVDPSELSKVVTMDGEVVKRLDEQASLATDGGTDVETLDLYCHECDRLSLPHRRDGDDWVCTECGNVKTCSDPNWSDNCNGDLTMPHEVRKGLCEGCMTVIESWSNDGGDEDSRPGEQQTLVTDGGVPDPDAFRIPTIAELDAMRAAANLSMADLSECAGFTDNRFSHILTNDVNPQTRTIRAFLTALQEFDGHTESGDQGPAPDTSDLVDDDGPTAVDVEQIAARLDRLNADDVGEDPTPPDGDETLLTDGGHAVRRGQTWTCNEAHADAADVPPAHDTVSLWPDYPRFAAVVDRVEGDVAQLTAGTSNSHPRAPDLGDTVDIHVDRLHGQARWSLTSAASTTEDPPLVTDGGRVEDDVVHDLTNRPVGDLSQAALKAEWSEAYERLASGTVEDRDGTWDRRRDLWQEMRERTNADPPECPECGATSWSQEFGGPKHCNGCGWAPTDEDMELIQRIDSYWSSVKAVDYGGAE